jgi:hypothetical protein
MRIKTFLLHIIFLVCFGGATAQPLDTIFIISEYKTLLRDYEPFYDVKAGHFPMQVYLPNNQQVELYAKEYSTQAPPVRTTRGRFGIRYCMMHCLRIIKHRDSSVAIRIVTKDIIGRKNKVQLTVDTTLTMKSVLYYLNIFTLHYTFDRGRWFRKRPMLYVSNDLSHWDFIPQHKKSKRDKYLKQFLHSIQYEYNAVTRQLTQLY